VEVEDKKFVIDCSKVYRLRRALYGYRRSPLLWSSHFASVLQGAGLRRLIAEPSLYMGEHFLLVLVHVDDFLITGRRASVDALFSYLEKRLKVKRVATLDAPGQEAKMLSQTILVTPRGFRLMTDTRGVDELVKELGLQAAKQVATPAVRYDKKVEDLQSRPLDWTGAQRFRKCTGLLMWLSLRRPDLQFACKEVARGMATPTELDEVRLHRAVKYIRDRPRMIFTFEVGEIPKSLLVDSDADWAGEVPDRKSTGGGHINLSDPDQLESNTENYGTFLSRVGVLCHGHGSSGGMFLAEHTCRNGHCGWDPHPDR